MYLHVTCWSWASLESTSLRLGFDESDVEYFEEITIINTQKQGLFMNIRRLHCRPSHLVITHQIYNCWCSEFEIQICLRKSVRILHWFSKRMFLHMYFRRNIIASNLFRRQAKTKHLLYFRKTHRFFPLKIRWWCAFKRGSQMRLLRICFQADSHPRTKSRGCLQRIERSTSKPQC